MIRDWIIPIASAVVGFFFGNLAPVDDRISLDGCDSSLLRLSAGTEVGGAFGKCVITSKDAQQKSNEVIWLPTVKRAGYYDIWLEYAADERRGGTLFVSEAMISSDAFNEISNGWHETNQTFFKQTKQRIYIQSGMQRVRLLRTASPAHLPHIRTLELRRQWVVWPFY